MQCLQERADEKGPTDGPGRAGESLPPAAPRHRGGAWESIERQGLLSTTALLDRFEVPERAGAGVTLCAFNSGVALYPNAPRRGPGSFQAVRDYPYDGVRRRRGRKDAVVEVRVEHALPDVADLVSSVERA